MAQTKAIVNKLLTEVSNGVFPEGYVADKVFPQLIVKQKTGLLGQYGMDHLRLSDDLIGGRAQARRVDPISRSNLSYSVETHALEGVVTQDDYDNVEQPYDAERDETAVPPTWSWLTKNVLWLLICSRLRSLQTTPLLRPNTEHTLRLIRFQISRLRKTQFCRTLSQRKRCGHEPKSREYLDVPSQLKDIIGFKYNEIGNISDAQLAMVLGVESLIIADAPYNSAKEGQTAALAQIWGDSILFYVKPKAAAGTKSLGYQIKMASQMNRSVYKYPLDNPPGANGIIVQESYQNKIVNVGAGYLLDSVP